MASWQENLTASTTYAIASSARSPEYNSSQHVMNSGQTDPVAFFLFFNCKTTGSNIHRDKIVEIGIQCWPYCENAPVFYSKVDNSEGKNQKRRDRKKKGQKSSSHPDDTVGHPFPVVWKLMMQWLGRILDHATSVIGTQIYPVFVAHHGDTYDFHFLFTALEKHGIGLEAPSELDIHFCDPVPLLKQYKEYAHPWLVESRSMALGSLLNDWLPGQFDIGDLYICLGKTYLAAKLYTQTPMYWLLKDYLLYSAVEWIEYYKEVKEYREDKKSLEDNFPSNVPEVQRKFAVRSLLQWGYNWDRVIELYKVCKSPEQFRQELKDCDVKSGAASQLTWKIVDMKLPQDGTREYKVRIKKNMPPQRYTHLTDRRGRAWILRVKNVLPPCIHSLNELYVNLPSANQWKVPENLLLIRFPEAWCPMPGDTPDEDTVINQLQLGELTFNSDDNGEDSCDSWDEDEDEEAAIRQSLQPVEEFVKEQPAAPPITTLQFGNEASAYNPFGDNKKHRDLQTELRKDDNAKVIKTLWESVKEEPKEPIGFGQTIKFCRPGGSEEAGRLSKKKDKTDDQNNKNRKGQGNKGQNGKGKRGRTFARSQSWNPESGNADNKKTETNQSRSRTISYSGDQESWDHESISIPANQTHTEDTSTTQPRDNAAAHRMINFHLAKNNRKPRNKRSNKKDGSGAKRSEYSQGQKPDKSEVHETSEMQHEGGSSPTKSTVSSGSYSWGNSKPKQAWGNGNPDTSKSPTSWGTGTAAKDTTESKQFSAMVLGSSKSKYPSSWDEAKADMNKKSSSPFSGLVHVNTPKTNPNNKSSPFSGLIEVDTPKTESNNKSSPFSGLIEGNTPKTDLNKKSSPFSGLIEVNKPKTEVNQKEEDWSTDMAVNVCGVGAAASVKSDDDDISSVISLGRVSQSSGRSNSSQSNMRLPRETSKAHGVAQKAKQQEKAFPSQAKPQLQKTQIICQEDSKKTLFGSERSSQQAFPSQAKPQVQKTHVLCQVASKKTPSEEERSSKFSVESKTFWGSDHQTHNSSGFHGNIGPNKGSFRNENHNHKLGWNNDRGRKDDRRHQNNRRQNDGRQIDRRQQNDMIPPNERRQQKLSKSVTSNHGNNRHGDYQPVVVNQIEESENWDEEVGDDECYGL